MLFGFAVQFHCFCFLSCLYLLFNYIHTYFPFSIPLFLFSFSVTSSSVWVNLPAAVAIIIFCLYLSRDLDIRRRSTASDKLSLVDEFTQKKSVELLKFSLEKSDWRKKVDSPPVEASIEQFTRHLISEWVVDLWYSRITSDRDGPEELVEIMNGVIGEISSRARDINLIDLVTRYWAHLNLSISNMLDKLLILSLS